MDWIKTYVWLGSVTKRIMFVTKGYSYKPSKYSFYSGKPIACQPSNLSKHFVWNKSEKTMQYFFSFSR